MFEFRRKRTRRPGPTRFVSLAALAMVVGLLAGCDTTPVVLSGTVDASPSGNGVGGVNVAVYADATESVVAETTTNLSGAYVLRASTLPDGSYRVRVGERWWPDAASWSDADTVALSSASPTTMNVSFDEVGSLSGGVVDDTGVALQGLEVIAVRVSDSQTVGRAATSASGAFSIPVVDTGTYQVLLVDPTETWSTISVGGATPTGFEVLAGDVPIGTIDMSTGLPYAAAQPTTTRVSVASDGTQGTNYSQGSAISANGRYVAYYSTSPNLVPGDTNNTWDVFVQDRSTGTTSRVSVASDGTQGNHPAFNPSLSADGRYIAFYSLSTNLVAGDFNLSQDVFVHDRSTGVTTRVSIASDGTQGNGSSVNPSLSADGRYIAFQSAASNLVAGDTNDADDVFVHDWSTGVTSLVSVGAGGTQANGSSVGPSISADGHYVTFQSAASNLVANDTNGVNDVFVHDTTTGTTSRVSVASDDTQANGASSVPSIDAAGRYIAFHSVASNLVAGDTNAAEDVFVHDLSTGTTTRVSVGAGGTQANGGSIDPSISTDGNHIAYYSYASNLTAGDTNAVNDVFVFDRSTGTTTRVSVASDGAQANSGSFEPAVSGDGRQIAFHSLASNLIVGDTNGSRDIFVHERPAA